MSQVPGTRVMSVLARLVTGVLVVALVVTTSPGVAAADPKQDIHSVQQKVDALGKKVADLAEQYNVARIRLAAAKRHSDLVAKRVRAQQANVERMRKKIAALATSAYMGGPADVASLVTADSPQEFLDKSSSLELLSEQDKRQIASFNEASKRLADERAAAAKALAAQRKVTTRIAHTRATILTVLAKQKKLLAKLQQQAAEERAKERAKQQAREQARERAAQRASRDTTRDTKPSTGGDLPNASGKAAKAVAFAKAQLGKPYQWGADGPSSYDCSGLTMMAWRQAGVSLPHSSSQQYASGGPHVSKSQLKPGDLVFFYQPVSHVGIYVGNGKMIAAPSSGDVVKYATITSGYYASNYTGAVRPG